MRTQYHSRPSERGLYVWNVERLVELSRDLPRERVPLSAIRELDEPFWCGAEGQKLTCRQVVDHARLMQECDLTYPIILSSDVPRDGWDASRIKGAAGGAKRDRSGSLPR